MQSSALHVEPDGLVRADRFVGLRDRLVDESQAAHGVVHEESEFTHGSVERVRASLGRPPGPFPSIDQAFAGKSLQVDRDGLDRDSQPLRQRAKPRMPSIVGFQENQDSSRESPGGGRGHAHPSGVNVKCVAVEFNDA